jgi:hypothetical protein
MIDLGVPTLVPSFSSCGFPQEKKQLREVTENNFRLYAPQFEVLLVSAYDIHHGYIHIKDIPKEATVIVDSGGYEVSQEDDESAVYMKPEPRGPWNEELLLKTLSHLPDEPRFIFVNLDTRDQLCAQVHRAMAQLCRFTNARKTFLIKECLPSEGSKSGYASLTPVISQIPAFSKELSCFDVIGVTEKSLGLSYDERIANLALLRLALEKAQISAPIHVFGALDLIMIRVYAMAGADIFDGLTWLRFAYREDNCIYLANEIAAQGQWEDSIQEGRDSIYNQNYIRLMQVQDMLRSFRSSGDVGELRLQPHILAKANQALIRAKRTEAYLHLCSRDDSASCL